MLCRPLKDSRGFPEPATVADMAGALNLSQPTVKFHLNNLYDKFGIQDGNKRVSLANEALSRGAVSLSDLAD